MKTEVKKRKFYDVRLMFRRAENNERVVRVTVRGSKTGKPLINQVLPFPDNINESELFWRTYKGEYLAVYHRKGIREYTDAEHSLVHTSLSQKLEEIILKTLNNKNIKY